MQPIIYNIHNRLFGKDIYYIYSMSVYHFITILYTYAFGQNIPSSVMYKLTLNANAMNDYFKLDNFMRNYLMLGLIVIIDLIFFVIIFMEFKPKWMTMKRIELFCLITLIVGFIFPFFREIMFFLSINTLAITVSYKLIKWSPKVFFLKYVFLIGSYIYIVKLIFYPLYMFVYYAYLT